MYQDSLIWTVSKAKAVSWNPSPNTLEQLKYQMNVLIIKKSLKYEAHTVKSAL